MWPPFFSLFFLILLGPKLVGEEQIWPGTWHQRRGFAGFRRIRGIPANFSDFVELWQDFRWNHYSLTPKSLFEDKLAKKKVTIEGILGKSVYIEKF
jgi:hypothetical protein